MLVIIVALYPCNHAIPYPLLKIILSFPLVILLHVFPNKDMSLQMISQWWEMRWHVWHCVDFSLKVPYFYIYFPIPYDKVPALTFPSWFFPLKTAYFSAFCRQGSSHLCLFSPPCSITSCQPLKLMSKVMTGLLLRRLRHSRGLVRVAKVVITREKNPHL